MAYTTLSYANGDGYYDHNIVNEDGTEVTRVNLRQNYTKEGIKLFEVSTFKQYIFGPFAEIVSVNFKTTSSGPKESETHGGDDVAIFAQGPMAHLFHRTHESSYIGHVMAYAACMGPYKVG